jgi:hypothetical protein
MGCCTLFPFYSREKRCNSPFLHLEKRKREGIAARLLLPSCGVSGGARFAHHSFFSPVRQA